MRERGGGEVEGGREVVVGGGGEDGGRGGREDGRGRGGEEGGGEEEGRGAAGGERQEETGEEEDQFPAQPFGYNKYAYSPSLQNQTVESKVKFTETYLQSTKQLFDDIDKEYMLICEKRKDIDNFLKQFKRKLGCASSADFPTCYKTLRGLVGDYVVLELSRDAPLCLVLEGDTVNNAREAVEHFNDMLKKCDEFPAEAEASVAYIREKIQAVEKQDFKEAKVLEAKHQSEKSRETIIEFRQEVEKLVNDVNHKSARDCLVSRRESTGLHRLQK